MSNELAVYLRNHHAGATAGLALMRRLVRGASLELDGADELPRVEREVDEDLRVLERVMRSLGVGPSRVQDAAAVLGERLGRLKPNGRLRGPSRLRHVVEAESLVLGSLGKEALWVSLARAGVQAGVEDYDRLVSRARGQRAVLERYREDAARRALAHEGGAA